MCWYTHTGMWRTSNSGTAIRMCKLPAWVQFMSNVPFAGPYVHCNTLQRPAIHCNKLPAWLHSIANVPIVGSYVCHVSFMCVMMTHMNHSFICDGTNSYCERETGRRKRGKIERLRSRGKREHERERETYTHTWIWYGIGVMILLLRLLIHVWRDSFICDIKAAFFRSGPFFIYI